MISVLTSSIIQTIHGESVQCATFESTNGTTKVVQSTVGFVDDNNNCATKEREGAPIDELLETSAQKWERILHATGGTLEIKKTSHIQ